MTKYGAHAYLSVFLLTIGSGFYLTQITAVSPIYPIAGLGMILALASLGLPDWISKPKSSSTHINMIFVIATAHTFLHHIWISPINSSIGFYLNFVFLFAAWHTIPKVPEEKIRKIVVHLVNFTIILGSAESFVRWFIPFQEYNDKFLEFVDESGATFYLHKFNSIMYQDSNFVAMWLLMVCILAIHHIGFKRGRVQVLALSALLALTICRSAMIFYGIYIISLLMDASPKARKWKIPVTVAVGATAAGVLADKFLNDDSFQSKITIFNLALTNYFPSIAPENLILGVGLSNSAELLDGIAAHNFLLELLIDTGALGLAYTVYAFIFLARQSGSTGKTMVTLYLLAGMSFAPMTMPYFFVALALASYVKPQAVPERHT